MRQIRPSPDDGIKSNFGKGDFEVICELDMFQGQCLKLGDLTFFMIPPFSRFAKLIVVTMCATMLIAQYELLIINIEHFAKENLFFKIFSMKKACGLVVLSVPQGDNL